jgi:hypothetical protein
VSWFKELKLVDALDVNEPIRAVQPRDDAVDLGVTWIGCEIVFG